MLDANYYAWNNLLPTIPGIDFGPFTCHVLQRKSCNRTELES